MTLGNGLRIAFFNLVIVGAIGCFLRYFFLHPISGVNYGYMLHAHSHLAFLGWVFMALYVLLVQAYMPSASLKSGKFPIIFIILQVANLGMLATFPIMGYALWSIVFSALHALTAMVFAWLFIRDAQLNLVSEHEVSFSFVKWALILMIISNLAPFALGPVSAVQGKGDLYYLLIYFYLHFQYNGWFTFALLGLVLWLLEVQGVNTKVRLVKVGFMLKLIAVFPAYILSALWVDPNNMWYVLAGLSGLVQVVGLVCLGYFIIKNKQALNLRDSYVQNLLFWVGVLAVGLQHVLMLLSAIPSLSSMAFARNIVIAYLHMVLIGFVSVWVFFILLKARIVQLRFTTKVGFKLFLTAFVITELVLVFQGCVVSSTQWLFYLAVAQLCGILCIAFNVKRVKME